MRSVVVSATLPKALPVDLKMADGASVTEGPGVLVVEIVVETDEGEGAIDAKFTGATLHARFPSSTAVCAGVNS
jgi:hypothetical protein